MTIRCSKRDAIPRADGTLVTEPAVRLDEAPEGHVGRVIRISDRDPVMLRELDDAGVGPGSEVRIQEAADEASVALLIGDDTRVIPREAAAGIWVSA